MNKSQQTWQQVQGGTAPPFPRPSTPPIFHRCPNPHAPAKHSKKDPARPTRAKAHRPDAPAGRSALERLLNPGIERGTAGMGSAPACSSRRTTRSSAAPTGGASTPHAQIRRQRLRRGAAARLRASRGRRVLSPLDINAELRKALGYDNNDSSKTLIGQNTDDDAAEAPPNVDEISAISEPRRKERVVHRPTRRSR